VFERAADDMIGGNDQHQPQDKPKDLDVPAFEPKPFG
jgi:hypothetical protein